MESAVASMTIRNIDEKLKARLRVQAARHGRSMEDEARDILRTALASGAARAATLVKSIRGRVQPLGGIELQIAPREPMRDPLTLE
jgi:plasmid stability protein